MINLETFQDVVRPDAAPVFMREVKVSQRFHDPVVVQVRSRFQAHVPQLLFDIDDLLKRCLLVLLGVCGLEQGHDCSQLLSGDFRHQVSEEVDRAALPLGIGKDL